jgi:diacylglycerol kinase (ATP)
LFAVPREEFSAPCFFETRFATLVPRMRAAAILGPGASPKDLARFQRRSDTNWLPGLPASSSDADAILIFGGDGTVHRYLKQLVELHLPVLVVPCGSGNDFARALGVGRQRDALAAWVQFVNGGGNVWTIDLGVITPLAGGTAEAPQGLKPSHSAESTAGPKALRHPDPSQPPEHRLAGEAPAPHGQGRYFCCVGGVGLDGEVARRANRLPRWLRGNGGYVLALLPALAKFTPPEILLTLPDGESRRTPRTLLAAFANTPTFGGGMKIAPRARLDDGKLDICIVDNVSKRKLLSLFPTIYFGRHLSITEVEYFQAEGLRLQSDAPVDVYADGEYVCQTPIEVSVARKALRVIAHRSRMPSPV